VPAAHDHDAVGRVPFWVHQIVEVLLGVLLLVQGARTGEHTVALASLGGVLVLLALCSEGPLSAWPWVGRRLHRVLDLVVAAVLALSPIVLGLDHVLPIVLVELAAAGMVWLGVRTDWRPRRRPVRRPAPAPPSDPASPAPAPAAPPAEPAPPLARTVGRAVGKARDEGPYQLGRLYRRARDAARTAARRPEPPPTPPEPPAAP
jgi:hypothetical protein